MRGDRIWSFNLDMFTLFSVPRFTSKPWHGSKSSFSLRNIYLYSYNTIQSGIAISGLCTHIGIPVTTYERYNLQHFGHNTDVFTATHLFAALYQKKDCDKTLYQLTQIERIRSPYKFDYTTGSKVFVQLTPLSLQLFVIIESSDKVILQSSADWPHWFANIHDQTKYEHI